MKISLLCPSFSRPKEARRCYDSAMSLAAKPEQVQFLLGLDMEEPLGAAYTEAFMGLPNRTYVVQNPRGSTGLVWNHLAKVCDGDVLHMTADDVVFLTKRWDEVLLSKVRNFGALWAAHYVDNLRNDAMACNPFVSRAFYEACGTFTLPELCHFFTDTWIEDIARHAGCLHFIKELFIEQRHWKNALADIDETYQRKRREGILFSDQQIWDADQPNRLVLAEKLRALKSV